MLFTKIAKGITSIFVKKGVTEKCERSFSITRIMTTDLYTHITVPNGVWRISEDMEWDTPDDKLDLSNITRIYLPSSLKYIGSCSFMSADISEIKIPKGCREISAFAFAGCKNLRKVIISRDADIKRIGFAAFAGCPIHTVVLPAACEIEPRAFDKGVKVIRVSKV